MEIISHRGYWLEPTEKNTELAFERSFGMGFGTETDVRDFQGAIVISHDMPVERGLTLKRFLEIYKTFNEDLPLALNIKSDCLQVPLRKALSLYKVENYFLFDMSVPDAIASINQGLNTYTRQSEYERAPSFYKEADGVWLDEFHESWITSDALREHIVNSKKVCIVSPELHKREHDNKWDYYLKLDNSLKDKLMLCTDFPELARTKFNG